MTLAALLDHKYVHVDYAQLHVQCSHMLLWILIVECLLSVPKSDRHHNLSSASSWHVSAVLNGLLRRQMMLTSVQENDLYSFCVFTMFS